MKVIRKLDRHEGPTKVFINLCPECKVRLIRIKGEAKECPKCATALDWNWDGRGTTYRTKGRHK